MICETMRAFRSCSLDLQSKVKGRFNLNCYVKFEVTILSTLKQQDISLFSHLFKVQFQHENYILLCHKTLIK